MCLREKFLSLCSGLLLLATLNGCGSDSPTRDFTAGGALPSTYSISGTITAAAGSTVDLDTNDPLAPFAGNDAPSAAQQLANPVVLGGYASAVATGVAGDRFASVPDLQDWFRITLTAGQTVALTIADHDGDETNVANPDLDLFLLDPTTLLDVQTSQGLGRQETITVLTGGEYLLQIYAFTAGSNYILTIGQTQPAVTSASLHIEDDFVPGEVIVRFREPVAADGAVTPQALAGRTASLGLVPRAGQPGEPMLFRLAAGASVQTLGIPEAGRRSKGVESPERQARRETLNRVKALRRRADVISADLNYIRKPQLVPNDSLFLTQWNLAQINLPQTWELTTGDPAVVVAVLDTGVLLNHPDLAGRLCTTADNCPGYDFVADPISGADGDGIDPDPADPGGRDLPDGSSSFHGTHTTGIVGAAGDNALGMAGVDWAALLMPVRVLGAGVGTSYDVMQGVRYAAGLSNDSGTVPGRPADIINLSLGGGGFSQAEQDLVTQLHTAGIFVIAAAGNEGSSLPVYPAAYSGVVSVSGVDIDKNLAFYANFGATIDLVAPGGNLATDRNGDGYADGVLGIGGDDHTSTLEYTYSPYMGTSMAAPHVAGVVGLMLAVDPALTPTEFDALLAAGSLTEDLGGDGAAVPNDQFGYGLIDAQKSVLAALDLAGGGTLPASLSVSPSLLNFGTNLTSLPLVLANAGGGSLTVTNVSFTAPWITEVALGVEPVPGSGLGTYIVTVDRLGLTSGVHAATVTFDTDLPASYPVTLLIQVGPGSVPDAGFHSIQLIDPVTGNPLQSVGTAIDPANGTYSYNFNGVVAGDYLVKAGTDSDHDGQICDPGEACGSYPLLTNPTNITVSNGDLTGIDFSSGF